MSTKKPILVPARLAAALIVLAAPMAFGAEISDLQVRRVKAWQGGTLHITFDGAVCGSQTWAKVDPPATDAGNANMLSVAISAKLSGNLVKVQVELGSGADCKLEYIQLQSD